MPGNDGYAQNVSYPVLGDAPNIETAFQTLVNGVVPLGVLRFSNANARAATLVGDYAPRPGMLTYLVAEDRYEGRMSDGTWQTLTPGPWQPLTLKSGFSVQSGSPGYRVINGLVHLRGRIRRTNNGQFATGTDWTVATLPASIRPETTQYWVTPVEIGAGIYYGRTQLDYDTGDIVVQTPPGATSTTNGLKWTGLDGLSYSL
ncbi:hypothetical protein PV332_10455 [Streptomyces scabiei]|uniref:hypothetical protein n=1 Tax=Streptomyces scabiei TaxID=1930 RepID=UPI0029B364A1|nr:hypothetical protein [Streptomyces scabiei]MDX2575901.1 hypothetical protein [Streptomyces scabiei]MDX2885626.1 hypothetical protein [Streptomyces scabiei]MDX2993421.1 hypothetical protein [Streptomyces scabiei]MDX3028465.1 hypothetical protein [Streptomyces scabiei]MDX3047201.1 hypothetical protein [Streptomyces scabiei]